MSDLLRTMCACIDRGAAMEQIPLERVRAEILKMLDETFENHHGIYLDKGTSLLETLAPVTAEEASRSASDRSASVAAHVKHVAFYLRVLQKVIRKEPLGTIDWRDIWQNARPVTPAEWDAIRTELHEEHAKVLALLNVPATWEAEESLWGSMAIVVHTAYHLGAVRQALAVVRTG